jgi:hypothetical protein
MIRFARLGALTAGLLLSALLSSCATSPSASKASSQKMPKTLDERALKRWDLLIAHKAEDAYEYLSPGFRQTKPRDEYAREMNGRPVTWTAVHFMDKQCDGDSCTVRLEMEFTVPMRGAPKAAGVNVLQEKWIRVSNQWFFLPEQLGASVTGKGLH